MPSYYSRRADLLEDDDVELLRDLHKETFGNCAPMVDSEGRLIFTHGFWWLVYPAGEKYWPCAFCATTPSTLGPGYGYLKRAGVLEGHRGQGLQIRMIRLREREGRRQGWHTMITDTYEDDSPHPSSSNNLIRAGYTLWNPTVPWSFKGARYWRKALLPAKPNR